MMIDSQDNFKFDTEQINRCLECGGQLILNNGFYSCYDCGLVNNEKYYVDDLPRSIIRGMIDGYHTKQKNNVLRIHLSGSILKINSSGCNDRLKRALLLNYNYRTMDKNFLKKRRTCDRINELCQLFDIPENMKDNLYYIFNHSSKKLLREMKSNILDILLASTLNIVKDKINSKEFCNLLKGEKIRCKISEIRRLSPIVKKLLPEEKKCDIKNIQFNKIKTIINDKLLSYEQIDKIKSKYEIKSKSKITLNEFREKIISNCDNQMKKIGYNKLSNNNIYVLSSFVLLSNNMVNLTQDQVINIIGITRVSMLNYLKKIGLK